MQAAAFGRLCVETGVERLHVLPLFAAAFGRLCVETLKIYFFFSLLIAAAFGRLCVETNPLILRVYLNTQPPSGGCVLKHELGFLLPISLDAAAFGRLCVETGYSYYSLKDFICSRLRAAVC